MERKPALEWPVSKYSIDDVHAIMRRLGFVVGDLPLPSAREIKDRLDAFEDRQGRDALLADINRNMAGDT
jgi:hypothetical protein